jgi:hypothetical protein
MINTSEKKIVIGSLSKRNMKSSIIIPKQLTVCIEGLETNIPFMTLETTFFHLYFLKLKMHMMGNFITYLF